LAVSPLDMNEGKKGDVLLEVQINLLETELDRFELVADGKTYREWCVPAGLVSQTAVVRVIDESEALE